MKSPRDGAAREDACYWRHSLAESFALIRRQIIKGQKSAARRSLRVRAGEKLCRSLIKFLDSIALSYGAAAARRGAAQSRQATKRPSNCRYRYNCWSGPVAIDIAYSTLVWTLDNYDVQNVRKGPFTAMRSYTYASLFSDHPSTRTYPNFSIERGW